ncbi:MAG: hypothetical protein NTU88_09690, partial [Armatimonadetes bacterium]|nr:hypothetical protein [Armatimonadota bacterium]
MKSTAGSNALRILMLCLVLVSVSRTMLPAAEVSGGAVTPTEATSNSVYEFSFVFKDDPLPPESPQYPVSIELTIDGATVASYVMCADSYEKGRYNIRDGIKYWFRVSAGLDLEEHPHWFGPDHLINPDGPGREWMRVKGCAWLKSNSDGSPRTHRWQIYIRWQGPRNPDGTLPPPQEMRQSGSGPTVHDSFRWSSPHINRYGGQSFDRDYLYGYPAGYPFYNYCHPLSVTPYEVQFPDEGSSTSTYTFRVHYESVDGWKPSAWVRWEDDWWKRNLDRMDSSSPMYDPYWAVFRGHHMYMEDPAGAAANTDYILRVGPTSPSIVRTSLAHWRTTMGWTAMSNHYYEALPPGRYEYFFACSDDDFSAFANVPGDKAAFWPYLDDQPALPTPPPSNDFLFGVMGINWPVSADTYHGYVSKRTYMPGAWTYRYPYDSWVGSSPYPTQTNIRGEPVLYKAYTYPEVDPGLYQIGSNYGSIGGARFLGTLSPYKQSVIPSVPYQEAATIWRMWSETAGGTEQDQFTF